jgi:hypothetical protein
MGNTVTENSRNSPVAKQVRIVLAAAYSMLQGDKRNEAARTYSLASAVTESIERLVGKPSDGTRSRLARLDALLNSLEAAVVAADKADDTYQGARTPIRATPSGRRVEVVAPSEVKMSPSAAEFSEAMSAAGSWLAKNLGASSPDVRKVKG